MVQMLLRANPIAAMWRPGLALLLAELGMQDEGEPLLRELTARRRARAPPRHAVSRARCACSPKPRSSSASASRAASLEAELWPWRHGGVPLGHTVVVHRRREPLPRAARVARRSPRRRRRPLRRRARLQPTAALAGVDRTHARRLGRAAPRTRRRRRRRRARRRGPALAERHGLAAVARIGNDRDAGKPGRVTDLPQTSRLGLRRFDSDNRTHRRDTMMTGTSPETVLTDEMLARFDERAPQYDRDNRFFHEDFEELRASGYLTIAVPEEFGGLGLKLDEVAKLQRRSRTTRPRPRSRSTCTSTGPASPPTCGGPATRAASGSSRKPRAGKIFAAGHGEAGNDLPAPALDRAAPIAPTAAGRSPATRSSAASRRSGTTSASTRWTTSDPTRRRSCTASSRATRRTTASSRRGTCSGMRATESNDTILERRVRPRRADAARVPGRASPARACSRSASSRGRCSVSPRVYSGVARRAYDMTIDAAQKRTSIALDPLDGVPPGGAALRRRDAHEARAHRRVPRAHARPTGRPASSTPTGR